MNKRGKCPLYVRLTINNEREQFSTGILLDPSTWNKEKQCITGRSIEAASLNEQVRLIRNKLSMHYNQLLQESQSVTASAVKCLQQGTKKSVQKLVDAYLSHNDQLDRKVGVTHRPGTLRNFKSSYKTLREYLTKSNYGKAMLLNKLTQKFANDFVLYLQIDKRLANATVHKNVQRLIKVMNYAVEQEWLLRNPIADFKFKLERKSIEYLSVDELSNIEAKVFNIERLSNVRDYFIFQCYTGLAYSDLKSLKRSQIRKGVDGDLWIYGKRQKNGTEFRFPLLAKAKSIIDRFESNSEFVFNIPSNQKMNGYLKEIGDLCGVQKDLTTHLGRRTFCTTVTLLNGVPMETVSKMVGHSSIRTTEQSYAKVLDEKISKDMSSLKSKGGN